MCAQDLEALSHAIGAHFERCQEHMSTCCGPSTLHLVSTSPDGDPIQPDVPTLIGHECLCGWRDVIETSLMDLVTLLTSLEPERTGPRE